MQAVDDVQSCMKCFSVTVFKQPLTADEAVHQELDVQFCMMMVAALQHT